MQLPLLPMLLSWQMGMTQNEVSPLYLTILVGLMAVGPLHAWLADTYRRKHVVVLATLGLMCCFLGMLWIESFATLLAIGFLGGACYGMAISALITISIDIVNSEQRTLANKVLTYALCTGALVGVAMGGLYGSDAWLPYVAAACLMLSALLVQSVYVAFRAPIGVSTFGLDRFFLPRTCLPTLLMLFIGLIPGLYLPWVASSQILFPLLSILFLALLICPVITVYVNLAEHCQRATSVSSCLLGVMTGILLGACLSTVYLCMECTHAMAAMVLGAAVICFPFAFRYYRKHKVRD
ncbi:MAG: hypothetical protein IJL37_02390 [Bacteroidaceae bacterium]|nr:hypothetical protein [Bacteroidaceae bacterium]